MHDATTVRIVQTLLLNTNHELYNEDLVEVVTELEIRKTKIEFLRLITATENYLEIL